MDEVYTLEDSVERQMSPETTKKKKKKKRIASLLENEEAKETRKSESADNNSSLMPSRELEEVVTMNTIGDAANEVFVSDNQVGTKTVLPCTHIKPRLPSPNSNESIFGDYSNTGHSSYGNSKDGYEDSSSPSAKALSIALQAPFFHRVDHAHKSPLRTEDEHSVSRESEDTQDSKGIDDPVSKRTSDFRMVKFPTRNLSRVSVCDNGNRKNVQIGSAEELTQTRHPEFIIEVSRGTVKEDCLLYCTDGEERIDRTESTNGSNISQGKTNPYDVHARDLNNLEEKNQNTSAETLNLELCGILEAAYCSETSVPFTARDIRLVDNETISLNQENNVKHDKEESERVVAETNSPLTLLECFESEESAKREEKRPETIECVPLSSKRVDDFVGPVSTSSTKNSKGDLTSPATCDVASTAEEKIDRETGTVFNATSEYRKIDHLTYRGKVPSLQCGAKPVADEQRKEEKGVSIPKETNKSKEVQGDDKEEGEITSEEEGASETQRQSEKGREEGELSSSDSDLEVALDASSQGTQKTKDLCSTRRQSSTELRQKSSKEKSRKPGNSGCDGGASLSSTKNSDLRTKLGQIRKKGSILACGSPDSGTHDRLRGTQSAENQGNLEKVKQDGFKAVNQTSKKEVTLSGSSQTKRRQTGKHLRGSGSSAGCNPKGNGQRNHVRGKEEINKERKSISLQDDDDRTKNKVRHTNSRRKTEGRSHNSQLKLNKTAPNSSPESKSRENGGNSRSFKSHKPKVRAKESTVTRGSPILKNSCIKEDKKLAKDSETEQKMKTKACSQVSDTKSLPKHVRMQDPKSRDSTGKRAHRNNVVNHLSDSSDERSLGRPLESETKAVVSTHAKCNSESDTHGRKMASSRVLSSQPKEQSKSASNLKVRDESKRMIANAVKQRNDNRKRELKQAKTTVKVSPRKASRKITKNVIANFTSKTKVQLERGETGSTRKRRTSNDTELHHAKKLRREPEENGRSKLPMEASKFEIPLSNLKRGENDIKSGYTDNSQKSTDGLHSPQLKTVMIGRNKCLVFKHRHINQLFLRGDNVVMVAYAK